jgi:hypoxanthine-DNA glycosylase
MKASSFKVIADPDVRVLILGSLPGAASLAAGQYYAHPRNAFWAIMDELVGAAVTLPYKERIDRLVEQRIALWDVCASARRSGSLDTAIQPASVLPNDIAGFLSSHKDVRLICFNGVKAGELFRRLVLPVLKPSGSRIRRLTVPSTSPAYAAMSLKKKIEAWREAFG